MRTIQNIQLCMILDSRGLPTIQCQITDSQNNTFYSSSPSGASTGSREAIEIRDKSPIFMGKSVFSAIKNLQFIKNKLIGHNLDGGLEQFLKLDSILLNIDKSSQKELIGGNVSTAVSFCLLRAVSQNKIHQLFKNKSFPRPMVNIINGGKHAGNALQIQEFMIVPSEYTDVYAMLNNITTVFHNLKKIISQKYGSSQTAVGDEGGYAPDISSPEEALDLLIDAIQTSGLTPGEDIFIALDCAASEYFKNGKYEILPNQLFSPEETIQYLQDLCQKYPIISIEDPFDENDFVSWKKFTEVMGDKILIVGDDLFTTSPEFCQKNIQEKWANALLVKVNQIGTVSQALNAINIIKENGGKFILSHRSGETNDAIITDIGVGTGAQFLKIGAPCRGERIAKYNRLIEIFLE